MTHVRNLILTGGIFHPFEESSAALADVLAPLGIESTVTLDVEGGLAALARGAFDLLTVNALRWTMVQHEKYIPYRDEWAFTLSGAGEDAILSHVGRGGGLLALHTASICFDTFRDWSTVLGGRWVWPQSHHPAKGPVTVAFRAGRHPVAEGLDRLALDDEIYHDLAREPSAVVVATGRVDPEAVPQAIMWAHTFGDGRVFYDALGHDGASIRQPGHAKVLQRATRWLLGASDADVAGA